MGYMKYEMKQERNGIQSDMLVFREEGIACLALFTVHGKINHNADISFQSMST